MIFTHLSYQSVGSNFSRPTSQHNVSEDEIKMASKQRRSMIRIGSSLPVPSLPWRFRQILNKWHQNFVRILADHRVLKTPTCITGRDSLDFEIHILLGKQHVGMSLWAIKSLLHYSGKAYSVVLHDDGSLTDQDINSLDSHLVGSKVIRRADADSLMAEKLVGFPNAYKYRFSRLGSSSRDGKASVFSLKLLDFTTLSNAKKILVLDSDVLFFKRPDEIIDWVDDPLDRDSLYCYEMYVPIRNARNKIICFKRKTHSPSGFNSGLICLDRSAFDLAMLDEWLGVNSEKAGTVYTFEQLAYNYLVKTSGKHRPLPGTYSFNYNDPDCVATHFGIKSLFFSNLHRVRKAVAISSEMR